MKPLIQLHFHPDQFGITVGKFGIRFFIRSTKTQFHFIECFLNSNEQSVSFNFGLLNLGFSMNIYHG